MTLVKGCILRAQVDRLNWTFSESRKCWNSDVDIVDDDDVTLVADALGQEEDSASSVKVQDETCLCQGWYCNSGVGFGAVVGAIAASVVVVNSL